MEEILHHFGCIIKSCNIIITGYLHIMIYHTNWLAGFLNHQTVCFFQPQLFAGNEPSTDPPLIPLTSPVAVVPPLWPQSAHAPRSDHLRWKSRTRRRHGCPRETPNPRVDPKATPFGTHGDIHGRWMNHTVPKVSFFVRLKLDVWRMIYGMTQDVLRMSYNIVCKIKCSSTQWLLLFGWCSPWICGWV